MDQAALAAIIGAVVGSLGATFAAVWAGRQGRWQTKAQMRGHHAQWRREARRAAFADVIRACGDLQVACRYALTDAEPASPDGQTSNTLSDAYNGLHTARIIAQLEAPELQEQLDEVFDRHSQLLQEIAAARRQEATLIEIGDALMVAVAATGIFVTAAQSWLNDYDEQ
ncbi:hypothetical protein [Streptomyces coelicoflavus]